MKTKVAVIVYLLLLAAVAGYTAFVYPSLPQRIPTHWDIAFRPDAWTDKRSGIWLMPGTIAFMFVLMLALPKISPNSFTIEPFLETFNYVMVTVGILFAYIHVLTLTSLHPGADMGRAMLAGFFLFFAVIGNVLGKVRRNFWMGVRTPWTLASDRVWVATHRMAARLFVAIGVLGAVAVWLGVSPKICFGVLIAGALLPAVYSLAISQRGVE